jgi:hypothetical protein
MVNQPKTTRGPMSAVNRDGSPRAKPGKTPRPDDNKTGRLMMRLHPDVNEILDLRAEEKGLTRSKYVEQLLVGFLGSDPRNPRMNAIGKIDRSGQTPLAQRDASPHRFAERWQRFVGGYSGIFGAPPPVDWSEDGDRFWSPNGAENRNSPAGDDPETATDTRADTWAAGVAKKK